MPLDGAWDTSCPDWEQRIREGRSLIPTLPLFTAEAELAVQVFNLLRLPDVQGNPTMAEAAGDWFREIVAALYGSRDPATNVRYIEEIFALIAKKNSKTTNGAGLMVTGLVMNQRPKAEFILAGATQAIADLAYSQAEGMIKLDPELYKRFRVRDHLKQIDDRVLGATLKIRTFDLDILTGPRPAGVLLDEVHLLGKKPNASKVVRQLRGGRQATPEGFMVSLTTQSDEPPAGLFLEELSTARAVRDGKIKAPILPVLYEFPEEIATDAAQYSDTRNWPMVLPNLGRSLRLDALVQDWETERSKGAAAQRIWLSQHLNIEIGLGLRSDRWRGADWWELRGDATLTLDTLLERSEVVVVAIDGGGLDDLLGLNVLGRERGTRRWLSWNRTWAHSSVLELRKSEAPRFLDFVKVGDLWMVDRMTEAFEQCADLVAQVNDSGLLHQVGFDPMGVGLIVDALAERGIENVEGEDDVVVQVPQGWRLNGAIKTAEVKLSTGELVHAEQPIVTWAVGNAKAEAKGNAVAISKAVSGTGKIDPIVALFISVALMSMNPPAKGASVFDQLAARGDKDAQSRAERAQADDDEMRSILEDPRHPRFQEALARYNRQLALADRDEDY